MGLILWYPFSKKTKNYGGTENFSWPPIVSSGGPLGSFASFNKESYIEFSGINSLPNCSICFYFCLKKNLNSLNNNIFFVKDNQDNITFKITNTQENQLASLVNFERKDFDLNGGNYSNFYRLEANLNQWYHVVLICQNTILKVYINNKNAAIAKLNTGFGTTFSFGGARDGILRFCDIRIYDNCLDENDIARIYRGSTLDIVATERRGGIIYDHSGYLSFFPISSPNMPSIVANNMVFTDNIIELRQAGIKFNVLSVWFKPDWNYNSSCEALFVNSSGITTNQAVIFSPKSEAISFSSSIRPTEYNQIPISSSDDFINIIRDYKSSKTFVNGIITKQENGNLLDKDLINLLTIGGGDNDYYFVGQIKKITAYNNLDTQDIPLLYESEKKMLTEIEGFYSASTLEYLVFTGQDHVYLNFGPDLDGKAEIQIQIEFDMPQDALLYENRALIINSKNGVIVLAFNHEYVHIDDNYIKAFYEEIDGYLRFKFDLIFNPDTSTITLTQYGKKGSSETTEFYPNHFNYLYNTLNLSSEGIVLGMFERFTFIGRLYYVNISFSAEGNVVFYKNFTPKEKNNITGLTDGGRFYPLTS